MGRKILLVEDDRETASYLTKGLNQEGHSVEQATNGQDGLFRATDGTFDLIILDRMLPVLDGLSVLKALRAAKIDTPVLILSALASVGAYVTLAARTKAEIDAAACAIRARGEKAEAMVLDVTDVEVARKAVGTTEPFQILINNAGINRPAYLRDVNVEYFGAGKAYAKNVTLALLLSNARYLPASCPILSQSG